MIWGWHHGHKSLSSLCVCRALGLSAEGAQPRGGQKCRKPCPGARSSGPWIDAIGVQLGCNWGIPFSACAHRCRQSSIIPQVLPGSRFPHVTDLSKCLSFCWSTCSQPSRDLCWPPLPPPRFVAYLTVQDGYIPVGKVPDGITVGQHIGLLGPERKREERKSIQRQPTKRGQYSPSQSPVLSSPPPALVRDVATAVRQNGARRAARFDRRHCGRPRRVAARSLADQLDAGCHLSNTSHGTLRRAHRA